MIVTRGDVIIILLAFVRREVQMRDRDHEERVNTNGNLNTEQVKLLAPCMTPKASQVGLGLFFVCVLSASRHSFELMCFFFPPGALKSLSDTV